MTSQDASVREARYILSDAKNNNNKFWNIAYQSNSLVTTHWGRVGDAGRVMDFPQTSDGEAERFFNSKCREKEGKGYVRQRIVGGGEPARAIRAHDLAVVAKSQIKTNSPELDDFIEALVKQNAHNIMSQTSMTYNDATGLFSTPLGIVTADAIADARGLLGTIGGLVHDDQYDDPAFLDLLSSYMMIIPQNIGRAKPDPRRLYPDLQAVQAQNTILDALEGSLQAILSEQAQVTSRPEAEPAPSVFDLSLNLVDDPKTIKRIRAKYRSTQNRIHACHHLEPRRIFSIEIGAMHREFEAHGRQVGNIMELWHGTRVGNLLSILAKGMMVPPASSPYVTGRLFGDGLYFSDQSTKSLNYAYGAAPGQRGGIENSTFMFLVNVAMGKSHTPDRNGVGGRYPAANCDSTFAKANVSGVMNNEMIVYRNHQADPAYLIEFTPHGK